MKPCEARRAVRRDIRRRRAAGRVFDQAPVILVDRDFGLFCRFCGPDVERNDDGTATCKSCNQTA